MIKSSSLQNQRRKYKCPLSTSPDSNQCLEKVLRAKVVLTHQCSDCPRYSFFSSLGRGGGRGGKHVCYNWYSQKYGPSTPTKGYKGRKGDLTEDMYTHKQGIRVEAESMMKKLVIQPNITELVVRGNKEKEEKRHHRYTLRSRAGASVTCYCIHWEGYIHACAHMYVYV